MISIELPGEPRGWARPRAVLIKGQLRFFKDKKTRAFETALGKLAAVAMRGRPQLVGPVRVRVTAAMGVPKSWSRRERDAALAGTIRPTGVPDWDNFAKMLDAFNEIVWLDDSQIVEGVVRKTYSENPSLRVEVESALEGSLL